MIQPIRHHVGDSGDREGSLRDAPNQISPCVPVGTSCDPQNWRSHIPPATSRSTCVRDELATASRKTAPRRSVRPVPEAASSGPDSNIWNDPRRCGNRCQAWWRRSTAIKFLYKSWPTIVMLRPLHDVLEVEISHLLLQEGRSARKTGPSCKEDLDDENRHVRSSRHRRQARQARTSTNGSKWRRKSRITTEQYIVRLGLAIVPRSRSYQTAHQSVGRRTLQKGYAPIRPADPPAGRLCSATCGERRKVWAKARQNPSSPFFSATWPAILDRGAEKRFAAMYRDPQVRRTAAD